MNKLYFTACWIKLRTLTLNTIYKKASMLGYMPIGMGWRFRF